MRHWRFAVPVMALALAGCGGKADQNAAPRPPAKMEMADSRASFAPAPARMMAAPAPVAAEAPAEGYIAYSYTFTLELPADKILDLQKRHMGDCAAAGRAACQAIDMGSNRLGDGQLYANLHLRLSPEYLQTFTAQLERQTSERGGRILSTGVSSEDLTRPVTDTATQLKTKTELRDKFLDMLKKTDVKFADVVQVEREAARLQQEIDSATSMMNYYRARVDFSDVTIGYQSAPKAITDNILQPLKNAFVGFFARAVESLAGIVLWLAGILPWAALLAIAAAVLRWIWSRGGKR